jgi:hypothetical protein
VTCILAIDPGSERSAVLRYHFESHAVDSAGILPNAEVLGWLDSHQAVEPARSTLVIEDTKAFTLTSRKGNSYFPEELRVTARWVGRFIERWDGSYALMDRRRVKQLLCGVTSVGDPQVRDAVLGRFGGSRSVAVGTKKQPGPLYGLKRDLWAALAVALAYCEEMAVPHSLDCRRSPDPPDEAA